VLLVVFGAFAWRRTPTASATSAASPAATVPLPVPLEEARAALTQQRVPPSGLLAWVAAVRPHLLRDWHLGEDFYHQAYVVNLVAYELRAHGHAAQVLALCDDFRATFPQWQVTADERRVEAAAALDVDARARAKAAIAAGLAVLAFDADPLGQALDDDDRAVLVHMLCLRALDQQTDRNMTAAAQTLRCARAIPTSDRAAIAQRLVCSIDQQLARADFTFAQELADELRAHLATRTRPEPTLELYLALALSCGGDLAAAVGPLQRASADARLAPELRLLAAAQLVQVGVLAKHEPAQLAPAIAAAQDLRASLPHSTALARAVEYRAKLAAACAEAWLAHGDAVGVGCAHVQAELLAVLHDVVERHRRSPPTDFGVGLLLSSDRASVLSALLRLQWAAGPAHTASERSLAALLAVDVPMRKSLASDSDAARVRERLCSTGAGLLVIVPARGHSLCLAVDADGAVLAADLPGASRLRELSDGALTSIHACAVRADADAAERARADAGTLRDALLPPPIAARIARWRHVRVVTMGMLAGLPFEALPVATPAGERLLGEVHAVAHVVSLAEDASPPPSDWRRRPARLVASLHAPPPIARELRVTPYRFDPALLAACARSYGECTIFPDEAATPSLLLHADNAGLGVLHLIAHGYRVRVDGDEINALAFAADPRFPSGLLSGGEDQRLACPVVVVLSACAHGDAVRMRGNHPLAASLAGAYLRGGSRCVVTPLVPVPADEHMQLMAGFHAFLAGGEAPDGAMQRARAARVTDAPPARLRHALMQVHGAVID
jgi:hypothetical protein